ncbi:hypothetical protein [Natronolimnobius baerhuensis]|uniref:hypothetical protein n=1 Tax=Natronolimnobius baerhuensis TaxID=253108 RepID=UPI001124FBE5|nr:hypothetical protein [Natronolimnobius baerhuensis]
MRIPTDITDLGDDPVGARVVRVDTWNSANRHWVYYFKENSDGELELHTGAVTPFNNDEYDPQSDSERKTAIQTIQEHEDFTLAEDERLE